MEKPKSWLHTELRNGYTVLVFGRVAIPVSIFVGTYVAWGIVTFAIGVTSEFMNQPYWTPMVWFFGISGSVIGLLVILGVIILAIGSIIDVNARDRDEEE